jgi:hypothetical protein
MLLAREDLVLDAGVSTTDPAMVVLLAIVFVPTGERSGAVREHLRGP